MDDRSESQDFPTYCPYWGKYHRWGRIWGPIHRRGHQYDEVVESCACGQRRQRTVTG